MVKTIKKIGNSHGIIFDTALLDLARLRPGDQLVVDIHDGGTITLTPVRPRPTAKDVDEAIDQIMDDFAETMKKLS